uniref:Probable xyloglucan galactosyltransferase GT19 n=1 Tax=Tanacetum cinerariifolium TaxID=118510 RepID=A0A6L2MAH6_TANCI|nr:probable xyloglucan galactosyltransferase GT19 [Tanacetum cinerariifolium]
MDQLEKQLDNKEFQEIGSMATFKDSSNISGNDAHADDADIRPIYDEEPMVEKCVFNVNHDSCVTKLLNEVNSCAKVPSNKTTNKNKPVEQVSVAKKPERQILKGHRFSIKKTSVVHEKTMTPISCLRWKPTGKIFKIVSLSLELRIHNHNNEPSSLKLVPKVVPPADKTTTSQQELELLFSRMYEEYFNAGNQKDKYDEFLVMIRKEDVVFKGVSVVEVLKGIPKGRVRKMRKKSIEMILLMYRRHGSSLGLRNQRDAFNIVEGVKISRINHLNYQHQICTQSTTPHAYFITYNYSR